MQAGDADDVGGEQSADENPRGRQKTQASEEVESLAQHQAVR